MQEQLFLENGFALISKQEMCTTVGGMGIYQFFVRVAASYIGANVMPAVMRGAAAAERTYTKHPVAFVK